MKDEPISAGDLVMVIKPTICCGYGGDMGRPFTVLAIAGAEYGPSTCNQCGQESNTVDAQEVDHCWHDIRTLKKMPPQTELESVDQPEEVCV